MNKPESAFCGEGEISGLDEKGQIVVCRQGEVVKNAGGAAMIVANDQANGFSTIADTHVLPPTHVSSFSSRGPNLASPATGYYWTRCQHSGMNLLAFKSAFQHNLCNINHCHALTSVSLLKSSHPSSWSPAAIKSLENLLLMKQTNLQIDTCVCHWFRPCEPNNPGLIYDIHPDDYIPSMCALGYAQVSIVVRRPITCSSKTNHTRRTAELSFIFHGAWTFGAIPQHV